MRHRHALSAAVIAVLATSAACARSPRSTDNGGPAAQVANGSAQAAWISLTTLDAWREYGGTTIPASWTLEEGMLVKRGVGKDIVTKQPYTDFELEFEWMLNPGGNSGLFYRATEEYDKIYWSAPEYALLDDARHPDGKDVITSAGAAHSLYPAPRGVVHEAGTWNASRVLVKGTHVEHWLNGQKIVDYEYDSPDFNDRVAKSKFARWPNFAKARSGVIGLQGDHGGVLSIRGMRIRPL